MSKMPKVICASVILWLAMLIAYFLKIKINGILFNSSGYSNLKQLNYPPASEVSREVADLTERKNPHTPIYGVKEFVRLSVCLLHFW